MTRVSFIGRRLPAAFDRRIVALLPGAELRYEAREWDGALVVIERGEIELVLAGGGTRRFVAGDVIALAGLRLRALRNPAAAPALLSAVRRSDEFAAAHPSERPTPLSLIHISEPTRPY